MSRTEATLLTELQRRLADASEDAFDHAIVIQKVRHSSKVAVWIDDETLELLERAEIDGRDWEKVIAIDYHDETVDLPGTSWVTWSGELDDDTYEELVEVILDTIAEDTEDFDEELGAEDGEFEEEELEDDEE